MPFDPEDKKEVWLALRADGQRGTGAAFDPYDVSSPTLFADRMSSFQENTTIHLGPGIFQTFGYSGGAKDWQPKSGQRIVGAGQYQTILKVVGATTQTGLTFGVGHDLVSNFLYGFEASDFTVDCNMRGHQGLGVAIAAVSARGQRIRLRRIRAIDFGTEAVASSLLSAGDLLDLESFATKLQEPATEDYVSQFLAGKLRDSTEELLSNYTGGENNDLRIALIVDLNTVIYGPSPLIYDEDRFEGITLRQVTSNLLDQNPSGGEPELLARLNRLLLEDAYPAELANVQAPSYMVENFTIVSAGAHAYVPQPYDCVVEDCLIERPSPNSGYTVSCILFNKGESAEHWQAFHRACVVRNCVVDCEHANRPAAIKSISFSGTTATVTTKTPHGRRSGEWAVVSGALVADSSENPFNGSFAITVLGPYQFQYELPEEPGAEPTGEMWVGKAASQFVGIKEVSAQESGNRYLVTVTTEKPHFRLPQNNVVLLGVRVDGTPSYVLNRLFQISEIVKPTLLKFFIDVNPGNIDQDQPGNAFINVGYNGISADGGFGAVVEGNRVYGARFAFYHDTWSTKDLLVRKNTFDSVIVGVYQAMGSGTQRDVLSLDNSGTIATLTTYRPDPPNPPTPLRHTLEAGQGILVSGAADAMFNGEFVIKSVPTPTTLTYEMLDIPTQPAGSNVQLNSLWQISSQVIERNVIELVLSPLNSHWGPPRGIALVEWRATRLARIFVFRQVVIRENLIRSLEDAMDPDTSITGIVLRSCEEGDTRHNIILLNSTTPIFYHFSGPLNFFNNQAPEGRLLQGYFSPAAPLTPQYVNELTMDSELLLLQSI